VWEEVVVIYFLGKIRAAYFIYGLFNDAILSQIILRIRCTTTNDRIISEQGIVQGVGERCSGLF
jgi:hypothetical protein